MKLAVQKIICDSLNKGFKKYIIYIKLTMTNSNPDLSKSSCLSFSFKISSIYFELLQTTKHSSRDAAKFLKINLVTGSAGVASVVSASGGGRESWLPDGSFWRSNRRRNCLEGGRLWGRFISGAETLDRYPDTE